MKFHKLLATTLLATLGLNTNAEIIGGIDFPAGNVSFADVVLQYNNLYSGGPAPTDPDFLDPTQALGAPNYVAPIGSVTLGRGGLIELAFTDNLLTNSGDALDDLHVFEIGGDVEDTFVAIKPTPETLPLLNPALDTNNDGYFEIGKVFGATSSIDIDAFFPGFLPGQLSFNAVQLIDDPNEGQSSGDTVGADIDAVGAIASSPIPTPSSLALLSLSAITLLKRRRNN